MEKDNDGFARDARLEKAKPTPLEDREFKGLITMMAIVMVCVFGMGVVGIAMMFWRIWG
jgi:hypothetical protein